MTKPMKKTALLVVALIMLLSLTVAYAAEVPAQIGIYRDGSQTELSVLNKAIVPGSQQLKMNGDEATLTFKIQPIKRWFISWNVTDVSVDFEDGSYSYTPASFSGDIVTLKFPASELEYGKNFYHAKVKTDILGISIPEDFEFCITK
ncbi:MAG: hypothetical protein N4A62_08000 [Marinisporobacter sp.]|jgi:hypothetical protein|nr:hypothetical protein [Marinisporobacter sp.]